MRGDIQRQTQARVHGGPGSKVESMMAHVSSTSVHNVVLVLGQLHERDAVSDEWVFGQMFAMGWEVSEDAGEMFDAWQAWRAKLDRHSEELGIDVVAIARDRQ